MPRLYDSYGNRRRLTDIMAEVFCSNLSVEEQQREIEGVIQRMVEESEFVRDCKEDR